MRRRVWSLAALLALSACAGKTIEQGVLVTVDNKSGATGIVQLRVSVADDYGRDMVLVPDTPRSVPIEFPTHFSLSVPASRSGRLDIVIEGLDSSGTLAASATTFAILRGSTFVPAAADLGPVAPSCGSGQSCFDAGPEAGADVGSGGTVGSDAGVLLDVPTTTGGAGGAGGSDTVATGGVASGGGTLGSGGNVRTGGIVGFGGAARAGGVVGTGGTVGLGGATASGGATGSGGASGTGGSGRTGGATATGGTSSTGGATGMGGAAGGTCTIGAWPTADPSTAGPYKTTTENDVGPPAGDPGDAGVAPRFTLFRPANLAEVELCHPVITWGSGTGSTPSMYGTLLKNFASHGFVVIASNNPNVGRGTPAPMLVGVTWVLEQNEDPTSVLFHRIDTTHIGAAGHSQGAMATSTASADSHITTSLPIEGASVQKNLHGPAMFFCGGQDSIVGCSGAQSALAAVTTVPAMYADLLAVDHGSWMSRGSTLSVADTAFTAWMRVHLMADTALRSWFYGAGCKLCTDSAWTIDRKNMD